MRASDFANSPGMGGLFVYGSLKRGQPNHRQLAGARFIGEARTRARFALRVIDGYPALVPGTREIRGELFQVPSSAWPALDEFEGEGYVRAEVELSEGELVIAYLSRTPEAGLPYPSDEWLGPDLVG